MMFHRRIRAILGPTNTGKTHLAIEKMLSHPTGVIGFPLRLLARENYDKIVAEKGRGTVALITGEEKIIPPNPRWYVCTVEAMPTDQIFDFVAVDEIQMCANPERGHVFTDRLLYMRGRDETLFLGSQTMEPIITALIPDIEIVTRPRLSVLTYDGSKNMARLPARCAIVAFSVNEVYAIAEQIRQQRGGCALVLGALSPSTRNQQVALYQSGEVDYLVATDAIGMGLNMDVNHVAFASTTKFDGRLSRQLLPAEIAQIAGRAGRHTNNGTFGVTNGIPDFERAVIEAVETHTFAPDKFIYWRNRDLDFKSPALLLRSLKLAPDMAGGNIPCHRVRRIRGAEDSDALQSLMQVGDIMDTATTPDRVQLLWDVCQIPDFCQVSPDMHAQFLHRIYMHLSGSLQQGGVPNLPHDFIAEHIEKLNDTDGSIDTLTTRLANVRTWAYITHKDYWLADSKHWQHRTRQIEDALSNTLHQRLMARFVDERTSVLVRKNDHSPDDLILGADGGIALHGHELGAVQGIAFVPDNDGGGTLAQQDKNGKKMLAIATPLLNKIAPDVVAKLEQSPATDFTLNMQTGNVIWQGKHRVAVLHCGQSILYPRVVIGDCFVTDGALLARVQTALDKVVKSHIRHGLKPLCDVQDIHLNNTDISAHARAILYGLYHGLGTVRRGDYESQIAQLTPADKSFFAKHYVRFGVWWIYMGRVLSPKCCRMRALLACVHGGHGISPLTFKTKSDSPIPSLAPAESLSTKLWEMAGYMAVLPKRKQADIADYGGVAIRADHWEHIAHGVRTLTVKTLITDMDKLGALFPPNPPAVMGDIMGFLGYKRLDDGTYKRIHQRPKPTQSKPQKNPKDKGETTAKGKKSAPKKPKSTDSHSPFAILQGVVGNPKT